MKIAVCLSGQPRSIEFARKSIQRYFSDTDQHQYDFFCHSWNYNTWKLQDNTFTEKEIVDDAWLIDQLQIFKPKLWLIQTEEHYNSAINHKHMTYGSLFYSMMIANNLKKQYELAHDFRYDCVVKIRYDSIFDPNTVPPFISQGSLEDRLIHFPHCWRMPLEYNRINTSECIFYGDSWGMDIACDMFRMIPRTARRLDDFIAMGPGTYLSEYLNNRNVAYSRASEFEEIFYRKEASGLDPIDNFKQIKDLHMSFYTTQTW